MGTGPLRVICNGVCHDHQMSLVTIPLQLLTVTDPVTNQRRASSFLRVALSVSMSVPSISPWSLSAVRIATASV